MNDQVRILMTNSSSINPVTQVEKFSGMSERYSLLNSQELITELESKGLIFNNTSYGKVRTPSKNGFQKHVMIFDIPSVKIDDQNKLRLLVTNSHDGSTGIVFNLGVFRTVCANGLVVGDSFFKHSIRHVGEVKFKVNEIMASIQTNATRIVDAVNQMKARILTLTERNELIKSILMTRLNDRQDFKSIDVESIMPLRQDDTAQDLYTVFNLAQERLIRGQVQYKVTQKNDQGIDVVKEVTLRKLGSISKQIKLNKEAWNIASLMIAA